MQVFNFVLQLVFVCSLLALGVIFGDYLGFLLYGNTKQDWIEGTNTKDNEDA